MEKNRFWLAVGLGALALATPLTASAQDGGVNGHGFGLTAQDGDVRDPLTVERPGKMNGGEFYTSVVFEYADGTMDQVVRDPNGEVGDRATYLDNLLGANLVGGATVAPFLRFDLRLPVFFSARGFNANDPAGQPIGGGVGTMRAAAMVAPLTPDDGGFGLGFVPWLDLPTATASKNMGYGGLSGGTKLAATVEAGGLTLGGDVGLAFRPKVEGYENIGGADQLMAGIGAGYAISDNIGINLEANFAPALRGEELRNAVPDGVPSWAESPSEAILSVRGRTNSGVHWLAGGSTALSPGVGAARYRIFIGGGFGKVGESTPKIGDIDKDGIADDQDKCPEEAEVFNDYKDADGCADSMGTLTVIAKQYYEVVEDVDITITGMGDVHQVTTSKEPVSVTGIMPGAYDVRSMDSNYEGNIQIRVKEGDNKVELEVQPTTPGTLSVNALDQSGNPISGALVTVAAPGGGVGKEFTTGASGNGKIDLAPGYYSVFVQADGYGIYREDSSIVASEVTEITANLAKAKTQISKERIEILEKVFFQKGSAVIQARSFPLLDEVANVMLRNPDIKMLEVQGHTSSEGSLEFNNKLSKDRAEAVLRYLIERGVAENHLEAVGYGPSQPLVKENTEADRAKNRRVEFVIKKRVK